jgi:hypothetical protein
MLVRLPEAIPVLTRELPGTPILVRSLLVVEEVPGQRWRYIGFNDALNMEKMAYTQGWFDVDQASAKAQLIEGQGVPDDGDYRLTGEDVVWQFLLNLMLALEHKHLDGRQVRPRVPKGRASRKFKQRSSPDPYTVVRLSQASKAKANEQAQKRRLTPQGRLPQRRHLRRGHWKTVWRGEPEDSPIYATKPRMNRKGELTGGYLYKTATWVFPYWAGAEGRGPSEPHGLYRAKK